MENPNSEFKFWWMSKWRVEEVVKEKEEWGERGGGGKRGAARGEVGGGRGEGTDGGEVVGGTFQAVSMEISEAPPKSVSPPSPSSLQAPD